MNVANSQNFRKKRCLYMILYYIMCQRLILNLVQSLCDLFNVEAFTRGSVLYLVQSWFELFNVEAFTRGSVLYLVQSWFELFNV